MYRNQLLNYIWNHMVKLLRFELLTPPVFAIDTLYCTRLTEKEGLN